MFDKVIVQESEVRTVTVPYEKTIHEHRAPTDESVRLLKEFEEKALKKIVDSFRIKSTELNAIALHIEEVPLKLNTHYIIAFDLNKVRHKVIVDIDSLPRTKKELAELFKKKIAEGLSEYILKHVMSHFLVLMQQSYSPIRTKAED